VSSTPQITAPPPLTAEAAAVFGLTKRDLLTDGADGCTITQTGAFTINADAPKWPTHLAASEPRIETFTVTIEGDTVTTEPTGTDVELIAGFANPAQRIAQQMVAALHAAEVQVQSPGWITASVTPSDQVGGLAHMDDDMFVPTDDVGAVCICGNLDGPRVAVGTLDVPAISRPTQVTIPDQTIDAFTEGQIAHQQAAANEVVVLPQFGQLHAGPRVLHGDAATMRYLLVMRVRTTATN